MYGRMGRAELRATGVGGILGPNTSEWEYGTLGDGLGPKHNGTSDLAHWDTGDRH